MLAQSRISRSLAGGSRLVTGRAVRLRAKRVGSGTALQHIVVPLAVNVFAEFHCPFCFRRPRF